MNAILEEFMNIQETQAFAQSIDGWLLNCEGRVLYRLAKRCGHRGVIVEIGSWQGKSTVWLAAGTQTATQRKIYAIDPHTGSQEHQDQEGKGVWTLDRFKENLQRSGLGDRVVPLVKMSWDALQDVSEPIELLFIDGAHDEASVLKDFHDWSPKVVENGVIAFHDTIGWPGPRAVVKEHLFFGRHFADTGFLGSICWGRKVEQNTAWDRIRNACLWWCHEIFSLGFQIASNPRIKTLLGRK